MTEEVDIPDQAAEAFQAGYAKHSSQHQPGWPHFRRSALDDTCFVKAGLAAAVPHVAEMVWNTARFEALRDAMGALEDVYGEGADDTYFALGDAMRARFADVHPVDAAAPGQQVTPLGGQEQAGEELAVVDAVGLELLMQQYMPRDEVSETHARNRWGLPGDTIMRERYREKARVVLAVIAAARAAFRAGDASR